MQVFLLLIAKKVAEQFGIFVEQKKTVKVGDKPKFILKQDVKH